MRIKLPDGSVKVYDGPVSPAEVAAELGPEVAKAAIGARVNGQLWDLNRLIEEDAEVEILTRPGDGPEGISGGADSDSAAARRQADALYFLRHSCAHVMAEAICRLWPKAKLAYGPAIENGFYYDVYLEEPIRAEDFPRIEEEMRKIIQEDRPFTRYELEPEVGLRKLEAEGNKYKLDNARRALEAGAKKLSWYVTGPMDETEGKRPWPEPKYFEDLCMGPHVPRTGLIGAFKVMSVASSHWRGDITADRFQRVYGTAFFRKEELEAYLKQLEQARQRDHRVIGQKLGLFLIDEQVGPGLILWKPKGAMVRAVLQEFLQKELLKRGYELVYTPHIGRIELYKTSGHYPYYADSQFPPIRMREHPAERDSDEEYLLKPMNCPHHIKIYASEKRSYRDLPIRLAEFGTVYRYEQSGELTGMTRVRGFTQDDAHIFCTEEQVKEEFRATVELVQFVFRTFGFEEVTIRLSLRDPKSQKYVGSAEVWERAERELREVLREMGVNYVEAPGEAAFYGPKVDFIVRDVIGRRWQLGTVQLDYNLPERFQLEYTGPDNRPHRPVMIHRAPFGSMERFMAILIEHYAGAFPLWLAPQQVRVLPISDKFNEYGRRVLAKLEAAGLRAGIDQSGDRVQAKIRLAQEEKVPYMLVVGGRDQEAGTVSVRCRSRGDLGPMPVEEFLEKARGEIETHGREMVQR